MSNENSITGYQGATGPSDRLTVLRIGSFGPKFELGSLKSIPFIGLGDRAPWDPDGLLTMTERFRVEDRVKVGLRELMKACVDYHQSRLG